MKTLTASNGDNIKTMNESQLLAFGLSEKAAKEQAILNEIYISIREGHKKLQELRGKKDFEIVVNIDYDHYEDEINIMDLNVTTTVFKKYPEEFLKWANHVGILDDGVL